MYVYIIKVLLPTDVQQNCFKRSIKIYIKRKAPTCFGVTTIIRERTIWACWSYICENSQLKYSEKKYLYVSVSL